MKLKNGIYLLAVAVMSLTPVIINAQGLAGADATGGDFGKLLKNILTFINGSLIPFIVGIGFLVFVWGMFQFFIAGGANDDAKEKGKSLMIWAVVGFVMMFILWGIVNLLVSSTGLDKDAGALPKATLPGV